MIGLLVVLQLDRVHSAGWEWRLTPSAAPPKVEFDDRDYKRGSETELPETVVRSGTTPGGGVIYSPGDTGTPVVIYVRDEDQVWSYGLMGGP